MRRFDQHRRRGDVEDEPVPTVAGVAPISGSGGGLRLPRHRGTTAHVASIYPFHGGRALHDVRAPYVGVNVTDGHSAWSYDPFELYGRDLGGGTVLTNSNMLVLGEPGNGKSSAVKTMLYRQAAFYGQRRFISIRPERRIRAPRPGARDADHQTPPRWHRSPELVGAWSW